MTSLKKHVLASIFLNASIIFFMPLFGNEVSVGSGAMSDGGMRLSMDISIKKTQYFAIGGEMKKEDETFSTFVDSCVKFIPGEYQILYIVKPVSKIGDDTIKYGQAKTVIIKRKNGIPIESGGNESWYSAAAITDHWFSFDFYNFSTNNTAVIKDGEEKLIAKYRCLSKDRGFYVESSVVITLKDTLDEIEKCLHERPERVKIVDDGNGSP